LTALSLLAAFCCGLAWAHDDTFFAAVFGSASALTTIEAIRGLAWRAVHRNRHPLSILVDRD